MSFSIEGWVEVLRSKPEEGLWFGVIDIGTLIDVGDEMSERIFGLSRAYVLGERRTIALAAGRGLPPNPSGAVSSSIEKITSHEKQFGADEYGGYPMPHGVN